MTFQGHDIRKCVPIPSDTWAGDLGGQGIAILLTLMTGVALEMGLVVVELMAWPNWGLEGRGPPGL